MYCRLPLALVNTGSISPMYLLNCSGRLVELLLLWIAFTHAIHAAKTSSANLISTVTNPSTSVTHTTPSSSILTSLPPAPTQSSNVSASNPVSLVNLFIGTTNGGHVFPGACHNSLAHATETNLIHGTHRSYTAPWDGQSGNGYRLSRKCKSFVTCLLLFLN